MDAFIQGFLRERKRKGVGWCATPKAIILLGFVGVLSGGADVEFSLTVLFSEVALFSSIFLVFPILSKALRRVYWRTPTVSAVMRPEKLSITNEYAASSEKSVPMRRISMKLYTFVTIASKT